MNGTRSTLIFLFFSVAAVLWGQAPVIQPANPVVSAGGAVQFTSNKPVNWSLSPGSLGKIDANGNYLAPASVQVQQEVGGCQLLPNNHIFNTRIDTLPVHPRSSEWINNGLNEMGGSTLKYANPFGLNIVDNTTPLLFMSFLYTPANNGLFPFLPNLPGSYIESGLFVTPNSDDDRHIISVNRETCDFTDMYNYYGAGLQASCPSCTSQSGVHYGMPQALPVSGATDAAGMFLQPLAIRLAEIHRGAVNHAVRFTRVHPDAAFLWPATVSAYYGIADGRMPIGARLRLKGTFDISTFSPTARILLTQLKQYGMILADAGLNWEIQTMLDVGGDPSVASAFDEIHSKLTGLNFEAVDESSLMLAANSGETTVNREVVVATDAANAANRTSTSLALRGVTVGVSQSSVTIQAGVSTNFTAWVNGASNTGVTWTLNPAVGYISPAGYYTAPTVTSPRTAIATATSVADPSATTSILVNVIPAGSIRISIAPSVNGPRTNTAYGPDSQGNLWWKDMAGEEIPIVVDDWWPGNLWPQLPDIGLYYSNGHTLADWKHRFLVPNGDYKITLKMARAIPVPAGITQKFYFESQGVMVDKTFDLATAPARTPMDVTIPAHVTDNTLYFTLRNFMNASGGTVNWPPELSAYLIEPATIAAPPPVSVPSPTAASTATFVKTDRTTQGNWKPVYGKDGYAIEADATKNPTYAAPSFASQSIYTWSLSTPEVRGLSKATTNSDRIAATWYSYTSFTIDVNAGDLKQHQVALYCLDWDRLGRGQRVDVVDAAGNVLSTQTLTGFEEGAYLVWNVTGHVTFRLTRTQGINAVVSGVFFDTAGFLPAPPVPSAVFLNTDTGKQGNWTNSFGADGYSLAGDSTKLPDWATSTLSGQLFWTWAAATSDVRALTKATLPSSRIAATWYSFTSFSIDLNITDTAQHMVSLYCVDWDRNDRRQKIEVLDSNGTVLNTQALTSDFTNGVYLSWNVTGHVVFRVTRTGGSNAVVSGLFFR